MVAALGLWRGLRPGSGGRTGSRLSGRAQINALPFENGWVRGDPGWSRRRSAQRKFALDDRVETK